MALSSEDLEAWVEYFTLLAEIERENPINPNPA